LKILSLDLGTQTGWAFQTEDMLFSGTEEFKPARGDTAGMKYLLFSRWLKDVALEMDEGDLIAYERAHMRGGHATEIAHGFQAMVRAFAAENKMETMAVHTATIKKETTGSGKASKHDMLEHAIQNWPDQFEGNIITLWDQGQLPDGHPAFDQADALALMSYVLSVV
jgi:hypothetical protein